MNQTAQEKRELADHDLLIEIKTELKLVREILAEEHKTTRTEIGILKASKADLAQFVKLQTIVDENEKYILQVKTTIFIGKWLVGALGIANIITLFTLYQ